MRLVKTKKKAYELAGQGNLYYIDESGIKYNKANIGLVISQFGILKFYSKKS